MKVFLPLVVLLLSGCVTGKIQATSSEGQLRTFTDADLESKARCGLRVCVMNDTSVFRVVSKVYGRENGFDAKIATVPNGAVCDLGIKFTNVNGDHSDVYDGFDGKHLFRIDAHFRRAARILCALYGPGEPLGEQLAKKRAAAGVVAGAVAVQSPSAGGAAVGSAPPVSQGLSAADIQRIAQAVRGAEPAQPASVAAPLATPRFTATERADDLAVIVGIESYSDIATKAPYAERDADAFKAHVRALGVPERNIVLLKGPKAGRAALQKNLEAWLPRMAKPESRVYFYFSGHGAPDVKTGHAYLVPWDGDPSFLSETAYPVARLYEKLAALPAKQVLVAMDSCFSGAGGRSVLASGARPLVGKVDGGAVPSRLTVLSASAASEISGSLDERQHGAFTWFLLEGLNAGKTTPKALIDYLTPRVQDEARRLNRDQTPQLQGDGAWSLR
ncbi:MAG: caspase family protein [Elusimicrobiota bacterium]|nr:caspase family protein [Elusimicrobiota bacterium]